MTAQETLAIVPARGGSKSVPGKNVAKVGGVPLVARAVQTALACKRIHRTIVTTDDATIRDVAVAAGAEAPFMRPPHLAEDATPDLPVFVHALDWLAEHEGYEPEIIVQLRPTTPLRRSEVVDEAVRILADDPEADSVRAVCRPMQNPFKMWSVKGDYLEPLIDLDMPEPYNQPRQHLPEVYWQTGYVDVIRRATLLAQGSMTGKRIRPLFLDGTFVLDIDDPVSLELGDFLLQRDRY